jgi:AAA family ATP:ADP antiporter
MVGSLLEHGLLETQSLLAVATMPLFASIILTRKVEERELANAAEHPAKPKVEEKSAGGLSFLFDGARLVMVSRFILAAALVTMLVNWVNTNGENLLFKVVNETLEEEALAQGLTTADAIREFTHAGVTAFYGDFFFWVNIVALVLQSVFASRLLKYGGFAAILLLLPVIAMVSYTTMALLPILAIVKMMKIAENATDYSINNTARHVLWLPVSSEMRFRGKPAIDTLYVRIGDGFAALTVLVGVQLLAIETETFFIFNVALVLLWLAFAILLIREHRKASEAQASHGVA